MDLALCTPQRPKTSAQPSTPGDNSRWWLPTNDNNTTQDLATTKKSPLPEPASQTLPGLPGCMRIYPYTYRETHCPGAAENGFILGACGNVEMVTLKRARDHGAIKGCGIERRICEVCEVADALMRREEEMMA